MSNENEGEKSKLNNDDPHINRGFELMLKHHNRRENPSEPKGFLIHFGKMISLLSREIKFEIMLQIQKTNSRGE